jgi:hypothetical protein
MGAAVAGLHGTLLVRRQFRRIARKGERVTAPQPAGGRTSSATADPKRGYALIAAAVAHDDLLSFRLLIVRRRVQSRISHRGSDKGSGANTDRRAQSL